MERPTQGSLADSATRGLNAVAPLGHPDGSEVTHGQRRGIWKRHSEAPTLPFARGSACAQLRTNRPSLLTHLSVPLSLHSGHDTNYGLLNKVYRNMSTPSFRTAEVAQLYEETKVWSHPEHPFLDRNYSPGSRIPAIDFTSHVTTWLAEDRINAIAELWEFLSFEGDASRHALRKALSVTLPSWIQISDTARHELHAIYILTMRAAMCSNQQSTASVGAWLAATTLACRQLSLRPDYDRGEWTSEMTRISKTMPLAPAYSASLLKAVRSETDSSSLLGSVHGKDEGARLALEKAMSPLGAIEGVAEKLKAIPPMARFVVYDYVFRGWSHGMLRFDLYYGDREYGCGVSANQQYVEWLGFFGPPSDESQIPATITKEILREALAKRGLATKKSDSKKALVEKGKGLPGFVSELIVQLYPQQRQLLTEWKGAVNDWAIRVRYLEAVAKAILKIMAMK